MATSGPRLQLFTSQAAGITKSYQCLFRGLHTNRPPSKTYAKSLLLFYVCAHQVNGALSAKGELVGVGVISHHFWVLVNPNIIIDYEWNPNTVKQGELGMWGLDVDMENLIVHVHCQNAAIRIHLTHDGEIHLQIDITNR